MDLTTFNQSPAHVLKAMLEHCVKIPRWAEELTAARPFPSTTAILDYAQQRTQTWQWQEILDALNTHPRIGEKQAKAALSAKELAFSAREQAASQDQQHTDALLQGNIAYETRFGYIFLIKASGVSSSDILENLQQRLTHSAEYEQTIVHQHLSGIAMLRLTQELQA